MELSRQIDEAYMPAYDRCRKTLQTYPVSIVEVRDKDLPDARSAAAETSGPPPSDHDRDGQRLDELLAKAVRVGPLTWNQQDVARTYVLAPI